MGGEVIEANEDLVETPATINASAQGDGWFYKLKLANVAELEELMDEEAYKAYLEELE